jgi:hypothetical protein
VVLSIERVAVGVGAVKTGSGLACMYAFAREGPGPAPFLALVAGRVLWEWDGRQVIDRPGSAALENR